MADIRRAPGLQGVVEALDRFNRRHPWSHNDHLHGWILRQVPATAETALDVGCGQGALALRLATRVPRVVAVDTDPDMARDASAHAAGIARVTVRQQSFPDAAGAYDVVTMVAVLHHLDLEPALRHASELLSDGGRLLVVGLARVDGAHDLAWDLASAVLNPLVGLVRHPRAVREPAGDAFPVRDPALSFAETREIVSRVLPGARLRRRLFFRYTLAWTKPGHIRAAGAPSGKEHR